MKAFTIFGRFWGQNQFLLQIYETIFLKQFSLKNFSFLFYTPKCLETCVNCVTKCIMAQNLPHENLNFSNHFFLISFTDSLNNFSTSLRPHYQNSFLLNYFFLFSTINSRMSWNMCIQRHKLCNAKTCVGPTFTWSNEP